MTATDNKGSNLGKKRTQNGGAKFIRAKKQIDLAIQALGSEPQLVDELKSLRDRLLNRFVEEERKASL